MTFSSFEEFVTAGPPEGLGCDWRVLHSLCRDDGEAQELIRKAVAATAALENPEPLGRHGGDRGKVPNSENGTLKKGSNSAAYRIRKLRRDHPDLPKLDLPGLPRVERTGKKMPERALLGFSKPDSGCRLEFHGTFPKRTPHREDLSRTDSQRSD